MPSLPHIVKDALYVCSPLVLLKNKVKYSVNIKITMQFLNCKLTQLCYIVIMIRMNEYTHTHTHITDFYITILAMWLIVSWNKWTLPKTCSPTAC